MFCRTGNPHLRASVRLRRRTIGGVSVEIVGLFVSSHDENLAAGGRLQRDEAVIKMARAAGLNNREIAALFELTSERVAQILKKGH